MGGKKKFRGASAQFGPHQLPSDHAAGALDSLFVCFMCIQQTLGRKKPSAVFLLSKCVCVSEHVCLWYLHVRVPFVDRYECACMCVCVCVCVCVCCGPTQSVMCVSAEHKAVCSAAICPERVNTFPGEPLTHDPEGFSAPLNMTIHQPAGVCVCVFFFFFFLPLFFLDVLMCTCMDVCCLHTSAQSLLRARTQDGARVQAREPRRD